MNDQDPQQEVQKSRCTSECVPREAIYLLDVTTKHSTQAYCEDKVGQITRLRKSVQLEVGPLFRHQQEDESTCFTQLPDVPITQEQRSNQRDTTELSVNELSQDAGDDSGRSVKEQSEQHHSSSFRALCFWAIKGIKSGTNSVE